MRQGFILLAALAARSWDRIDGFVVPRKSAIQKTHQQSSSSSSSSRSHGSSRWLILNAKDMDIDDDDDDIFVDADALGDWRTFRRNLAAQSAATTTTTSSSTATGNSNPHTPSMNKLNAELLESQNEALAQEYRTGMWAHETATPEVGGLVVRLPLEVELVRNHRHCLAGRKLRQLHQAAASKAASDDVRLGSNNLSWWYRKAQVWVETTMTQIAEQASSNNNNKDDDDDDPQSSSVVGQIDPSRLSPDAAELLQLYLEQQETWQEVCLVLEHQNPNHSSRATTLVLNRPMALQLTPHLAQLVLHGAFLTTAESKSQVHEVKLKPFLQAFGQECAVYIGGPDEQEQPAEFIHGIADLAGAREVAPGTGLYRGGLAAAVAGVLEGRYAPLEFRFFVGRHVYKDSMLDVNVHLGKYQPIACARSLALKQCLGLPKPLFHEVMELCGGELAEISKLERAKRNEVKFQIIDEDDDDDEEDYGVDELDELDRFDDEDEDDYFR